MKLDLTTDHYQEIIKKSYSLDMLFLLNLIHEQYDVTSLCGSSTKITAIYNTLIRKGMITKEEKLTTLGIDLLDFISKKTNRKFIKKKTEKTAFDDWWDIYPSTDAFEMGTKRFQGSRGLRIGKEKCRLYFNKIVETGEFTKDDVINATLYDIKQRKSNSLKKNENQLTYLQNSGTYLFNESFGPFVPLSKTDKQSFNPAVGSTDI